MATLGEGPANRWADEGGRCGLEINRLPIAYLFLDADLNIREWNSAAEGMLGYTRSEVLGKNAPELLLPKPISDHVREVMRRIRAGDPNAHCVNENRTKSGGTILCDWFNTPTYDRRGNFSGVIVLGQDVTTRNLAEAMLGATQRIFQESFATARNSVFLVDDTGQFVDANPAACELCGYSREDILGLHAETIASGLDGEEQFPTRVYLGQCVMMCKDGRAHEMAFAFVPNVLPGVRLCVVRRVARADLDIRRISSSVNCGKKPVEDNDRSVRVVDASGAELISNAGAYAATFCNKLISRTASRDSRDLADSQERTDTHLTSRQRQVLQLIVEGFKTKQIASELGLSIKTIESHRAQLMKAVGIHDIPGLVRFAIRWGIVSPN